MSERTDALVARWEECFGETPTLVDEELMAAVIAELGCDIGEPER